MNIVIVTVLLIFSSTAYVSAQGVYKQRFLEQYNKIHNVSNGYFSKKGVPYHAAETIIVESSDYGHETLSETHSFQIWLEAMYGGITNDFSKFNEAWEIAEKYIIPVSESQPFSNLYNPSHPIGLGNNPVGLDPIYQELVNTYQTSDIYAMHWLTDVDNVYGFGNSNGNCELGPSDDGPSFINTYQGGPDETAWNTVPHPTCDNYTYGGKYGFTDLLSSSPQPPSYTFSVAPDADARAIQAAFWASRWATSSGQLSTITPTLMKAAKLGDYLRYSFFDSYFKRVGDCTNINTCPGGVGKDSAHYLLSWHVGWGGPLSANSGGGAWRMGSSTAHFGYQNLITAYALVNEPNMTPKSPTAVQDWQTALERQLELYEYVQSEEGAFGGGVTNSWDGNYADPPAELKADTFYGMFYNWAPTNNETNEWYGMQPWSTDRLAQYYYITGDEKAKTVLDKWVSWILRETSFYGNGEIQMPSTLGWSGSPPNIHCSVKSYGNSVGTAAATARTLTYYAAKSGNQQAKDLAKKMLDSMWDHYIDDMGIGKEEHPQTFFTQSANIPAGWSGVYPNGDKLNSDSTFISIRSFYKNETEWYKVENYLNGGEAPTFRYHRFWDQTDVALSMGAYGMLFDE